ncbi:MAG: type III pantothenate kinase [Proteobacteria bacterium]|nr:type III pantothenate kinase [Pseudomonadota bacterium]
MLLTIDVGNTSTKMGLFEGAFLSLKKEIRTVCEEEILKREIASLRVKRGAPSIISSVVPQIDSLFSEILIGLIERGPVFVEPTAQSLIPLAVDSPEEVGSDRIANAIAAKEIYGTPAIVVDFGTATTFDCLSKKGEYLGGLIAPGVTTSLLNLSCKAAKLPRIELKKPETVIGKSTVKAMQAGIYFSTLYGIQGILRRLKEELGEETIVVATGGLAEFIGRDCQLIKAINPALTLEGLRIIGEAQCLSSA